MWRGGPGSGCAKKVSMDPNHRGSTDREHLEDFTTCTVHLYRTGSINHLAPRGWPWRGRPRLWLLEEGLQYFGSIP
jgi:hypothetical protein